MVYPHYYRWRAHLGCHLLAELTPPADLNGLVRFAGRRNLVSARVPSRFKRSLPFGVFYGLSVVCKPVRIVAESTR